MLKNNALRGGMGSPVRCILPKLILTTNQKWRSLIGTASSKYTNARSDKTLATLIFPKHLRTTNTKTDLRRKELKWLKNIKTSVSEVDEILLLARQIACRRDKIDYGYYSVGNNSPFSRHPCSAPPATHAFKLDGPF